jgi:hypothetical protein
MIGSCPKDGAEVEIVSKKMTNLYGSGVVGSQLSGTRIVRSLKLYVGTSSCKQQDEHLVGHWSQRKSLSWHPESQESPSPPSKHAREGLLMLGRTGWFALSVVDFLLSYILAWLVAET